MGIHLCNTFGGHSHPANAGSFTPQRGSFGRRQAHRSSVRPVEFSKELRDDVAAGDITVSFRLWQRPRAKVGGRYRVGRGLIEVDRIDLMPFDAIPDADVRRAGESDREALRARAAHAGPVGDETLLYRVEFHSVR
jgi:hypothetical protein